MSKHVRIDCVGNVAVVHILEKNMNNWDFIVIGRVREDLAEIIDTGNSNLVLDLSLVECMPSGVKGMLITIHKRAKAAGGKMVMCGICPDIMESLRVMKLNLLFNIAADKESALTEFPNAPEVVVG